MYCGYPGMKANPTFKVSVTELAHFCCRTGDVNLGAERTPSAQQGMEGHKKRQAQWPEAYQKEVAISQSYQGQHCSWLLSGRLDGLLLSAHAIPIIEEIKTTYHAKASLPDAQKNLHLAQAKLYAALLCEEHGGDFIQVRLHYLKLDDDTVYRCESTFSQPQLTAYLQQCVERYTQWLDQYCDYIQQRNSTLLALKFPFPAYREGQRILSVQVYRDIRDGNQGLYHAPTGLGKTSAVLFPALRQLAEGTIRQIGYLTAKNSGHNSVQQALCQLQQQSLSIRVLFLQAKAKTCFCDAPSTAGPTNCPLQTGYYDRLDQARTAFQNKRIFLQQDLHNLAQEFQLCPHQLSRDLIPWVDMVVADYNYVFDPFTRLSDMLSNSKHISLLVDEAHNLPDRAREMFSASLHQHHLQVLITATANNGIQRRLRSLKRELKSLIDTNSNPVVLSEKTTARFIAVSDSATEWFQQQNGLLFPEDTFDSMMQLWRFAKRLQNIDASDVILQNSNPNSLRIFCTDPAPILTSISSSFQSSHFFSGSLLPLEYFQRALSTHPFQSLLTLASPFPAAHQKTIIVPINTRYQHRQNSIPIIGGILNAVWAIKPGRYLIAFPSYRYMQDVAQYMASLSTEAHLLLQPTHADPASRQQFMAALQQEHYRAAVIAGGAFAEGIDLGTTKLTGVIIVGTCLPPPSLERNLIQQQFETDQARGFDFAYRFPGINRVIQTAGRLIRDQADRGLVILLDDRFTQALYRSNLPDHWQPQITPDIPQLQQAIDDFFQN
jgi:DNA excision repair protein ERCC-2